MSKRNTPLIPELHIVSDFLELVGYESKVTHQTGISEGHILICPLSFTLNHHLVRHNLKLCRFPVDLEHVSHRQIYLVGPTFRTKRSVASFSGTLLE